MPKLNEVDWCGVFGNKDHGSDDFVQMFHYPGWRIDDPFWAHSVTTEKGDKIAFVHIDTNFLAYGEKGEKGNKGMQ